MSAAATPVSAVLITRDEEARVRAAVESVGFCDEVLVVDGGSTDGTCAEAAAAGARVMVNAPWPGFVAQRNLAIQAAAHDWILALDADERVSPRLKEEVQALRREGFGEAGYRVPRVAFYLGRWIRGTDWYPDWQLRLFDRRRGRWTGGLVHESVRVEGGVGRLGGELLHYSYAGIGEHLRRIERYTGLWAEEAFAAGRRTSPWEMAGATLWALVRNYLLKRGFLLGSAGLTVSVLNSYYTYAKLARLLERGQADAPPR